MASQYLVRLVLFRHWFCVTELCWFCLSVSTSLVSLSGCLFFSAWWPCFCSHSLFLSARRHWVVVHLVSMRFSISLPVHILSRCCCLLVDRQKQVVHRSGTCWLLDLLYDRFSSSSTCHLLFQTYGPYFLPRAGLLNLGTVRR